MRRQQRAASGTADCRPAARGAGRPALGRAIGRLAVVVLAAASAIAAGTSPADADLVNTPPTVSNPTFTMPGSQTGFQPDAGASDEVYAYSVRVGDLETLADINTVELCLYHSANETGGAGEGSSTCTQTDPRNTVRLTWTRSSNSFSISAGTSTYWLLGTGADVSSGPGGLSLTSGTVTFKFRVSEVMRRGTWRALVTATDNSNATATDSSRTRTVAGYAAIMPRNQASFGTIPTGGAGASATAAPVVTSNGAAAVSLTAGNFTSGSDTFTLKTDGAPSTRPGAGEVTFDCVLGGTFSEASAVRIGATATSLGVTTPTGTAEGGATVSNTCRIIHGGGRPPGAYAFTVVNAVTIA